MATFYNQATLSYGNTVTTSNITVGELISGLTITKTAASIGYGPGEGVTYVISLVNGTYTDQTGLTVTDDLGAYTIGTTTVVPLSYVNGSVLYYQNGILQPSPTVTTGTDLSISGITVPAGGNATIVYEATANSFAPVAIGGAITNTASANDATASATVNVREEASLTISKAICPTIVSDNGQITYTFVIQNNGNLDAAAGDNVTVTDTFNPILNDIVVTLDGTSLAPSTGYTYNDVTGVFSTVPGVITVPAATYVQDPTTGVITVTPGVAVLTVTGTI